MTYSPRGLNESVIVRDENNLVDASGLELVGVADIGGQVGVLAGGGEGSRDGHDDDLLGGELWKRGVSCCASIDVLGGRTHPCWR